MPHLTAANSYFFLYYTTMCLCPSLSLSLFFSFWNTSALLPFFPFFYYTRYITAIYQSTEDAENLTPPFFFNKRAPIYAKTNYSLTNSFFNEQHAFIFYYINEDIGGLLSRNVYSHGRCYD
ncbi:hypothetical protein V8C37DRAFT_214236 [Trichoderma ceciliae]